MALALSHPLIRRRPFNCRPRGPRCSVLNSKCVALGLTLLVTGTLSDPAFAQQEPIRKKMTGVDVYDAGQPQTIILKLFDPGTDVVCYILMPEQAARKEVGSKWVYDGNAVGSISCVPVMIK